MSNWEALQMATINNAIALGIDNEFGTVEKGKKADLIILSKNPLADLENLKSIDRIVKEGVEYIIN